MIQLIKLSDYDTISTINNEITLQGDMHHNAQNNNVDCIKVQSYK